jgi:hypothetical protein
MNHAKPLTCEQRKQFKELYLQGYSASLIFEKLGFPYDVNDTFKYNQRMRYYRVSLGLPKRGLNSKPKFTRHKVADKNAVTMQRIEQLNKSIDYWQSKIAKWKHELRKLAL